MAYTDGNGLSTPVGVTVDMQASLCDRVHMRNRDSLHQSPPPMELNSLTEAFFMSEDLVHV
jgi:glycyl-tRNA synthetase (class II)